MRKQEFRFQTNLPSPARRGSRSRPPLRRPRPLRFERLRVGGEGKADANLTNFLSTCCACAAWLRGANRIAGAGVVLGHVSAFCQACVPPLGCAFGESLAEFSLAVQSQLACHTPQRNICRCPEA